MDWSRGPVIGRGSTATVSLATSASTGHLFALKSADLSTSLFLQREQCILSNLTSPYIVKYLGSGVSAHNHVPIYNLCMQYAAGGTLRDLIRRRGGRLDEAEIRQVARRVLKGLEYLHGNGLVHCDIKSQNVLVDEVEGAIIGDFGCAKFVVDEGDGGGVVFSGTPAFMAPEVARGEEQGFPADVWAVGCTIIEMATGRNPWTELGDDPVSALYRIGFSDDLPEIPSWLSEEARDFVGKCLARDPRERWSAKELLDHPFLEGDGWIEFVKEAGTRSPSCVLDQGFWDSLDSPQNQTIHEVCSCSRTPPGDRIKSLITGFSGSNLSEWGSEEEGGWITVRSNESEYNFVGSDGLFLENEASGEEQDAAAALFLDSTIFSLDEEEEEFGRSSDSEDELWPTTTGLEFNFSFNNATVSRGNDFVVVNQVDENSNINNNNNNLNFLKNLLVEWFSFIWRTKEGKSSKQASRGQREGYLSE